jgi:hypothetical protein
MSGKTCRSRSPIRDDTPRLLAPIKPGLTVHGLRHGHKTWMAEDSIPEILAEQRLDHQVPGMRGLYTHASDRMRDDLKHVPQARWEDSLHDRAIAPRSPVPLLDGLLAPCAPRHPFTGDPASEAVRLRLGHPGPGSCPPVGM